MMTGLVLCHRPTAKAVEYVIVRLLEVSVTDQSNAVRIKVTRTSPLPTSHPVLHHVTSPCLLNH